MDAIVDRRSDVAAEAALPATRHKRPWFLRLARRYARRAVARRFDGLFVVGLDETARVAAERPVLLCANHVCWWDAFVMVVVDEALRTDGYALMDEANLARLPFFRPLGAIPLDVDGGPRARRQLDDAVRVLDRAGRTMWIFPQGRQRAAHLRPLGFKPGLRLIANRAARTGAVVVPVGLAYPWREVGSPSIVMRFGPPIDPATTARGDLLGVVEAAVAGLVDDIHAGVDADADALPGQALVPPVQRSREDGLAARLLGHLLELLLGRLSGGGR